MVCLIMVFCGMRMCCDFCHRALGEPPLSKNETALASLGDGEDSERVDPMTSLPPFDARDHSEKGDNDDDVIVESVQEVPESESVADTAIDLETDDGDKPAALLTRDDRRRQFKVLVFKTSVELKQFFNMKIEHQTMSMSSMLFP